MRFIVHEEKDLLTVCTGRSLLEFRITPATTAVDANVLYNIVTLRFSRGNRLCAPPISAGILFYEFTEKKMLRRILERAMHDCMRRTRHVISQQHHRRYHHGTSSIISV